MQPDTAAQAVLPRAAPSGVGTQLENIHSPLRSIITLRPFAVLHRVKPTMRLINVANYSVSEVNGPDDHDYAILSHTWGQTKDEVSFGDMKDLDSARRKGAWEKIKQTCSLACDQGIPFVWIDTCCIDKSSSAELAEAINSMFEWYKKATVCYTYLGDLRSSPNGNPESESAKGQLRADLGLCRWFKRGWTLQELIAPKMVEFYDRSWTKRGTKDSLRHEIAHITNIDLAVLSDSEQLSTLPVARKMSWAASRQTTRIEDVAYCLLGIFDVNLPMIYGEGGKAFLRLQEAIALATNDLSLFAWFEDARNPSLQHYYGALAQSPRQFSGCRQLEHITDPLRHDSQSFTITNRGVEFQTSLKIDYNKRDYLMQLYCRDAAVQRPDGRLGVIAIRLTKTSSGFARHSAEEVFVDDDDATEPAVHCDTWDPFVRPVHIAKLLTPADAAQLFYRRHEAFRFKVQAPPGVTWEITTHHPSPLKSIQFPGSKRPSYWDPARSIFLTEGYQYFTGMLYITFSSRPDEPIMVLCGFLPSQTTGPATASRIAPSETGIKSWAALHPPILPWWRIGFDPPTSDRVDDLESILAQKTSICHPRSLARLGQAIRARVQKGKVLPSMAMMKYRVSTPVLEGSYHRRIGIGPYYYRLVIVSGTTKEYNGPGSRIHDVLVTLKEKQVGSAALPKAFPIRDKDGRLDGNHEEDFERGVLEEPDR